MRKQFNLNYYLEHPETKIVTKIGNRTRILCTDLKDDDYSMIVAITTNYNKEIFNSYTSDGYLWASREESDYDLFFDLPDQDEEMMLQSTEDIQPMLENNNNSKKEVSSYTYEQMATLNLQLQALVDANNEAFFKLREECNYYKNKLRLIEDVIKK